MGQQEFELFCSENININRLETIKKVWLGMRDSNPRSRNQNPLPYHLANPQRFKKVLYAF